MSVAIAACERTTPPAAPPDNAASASTTPAQPLSLGPVTFFEQRCARCHGSYGAAYAPSLSALSDPELTRFVDEMVIGPGQTELAARDLAAQVAYHRSLIDQRPFLAVTALDGSSIAGEVTPGATVEVVAGGDRVPAAVTGHTWRAALAGDPSRAPTRVEARLRDSIMSLDLGRAAHSHESRAKR